MKVSELMHMLKDRETGAESVILTYRAKALVGTKLLDDYRIAQSAVLFAAVDRRTTPECWTWNKPAKLA